MPSQAFKQEPPVESHSAQHVVHAQDCTPGHRPTGQGLEPPVCRVAICDSYPLLIQSIREIVAATPGFEPGVTTTSLWGALQILHSGREDILILDGTFGTDKILQLVHLDNGQRGILERPKVIVFSPSFSKRETTYFLRAGIRGLLCKDAAPEALQDCVRAVGAGKTWIDTSLSPTPNPHDPCSADLTDRELQVLRLVSRGWKYKAIGAELGISAGTVKQHMKHIFEKTGARGRTSAIFRAPMAGFAPLAPSPDNTIE